MSEPAPERTPSRGRSVVFAAVVTVAMLWGINAVVERLEDQGLVDTHSPDDRVQFLDSDLFEVEDTGPQYVTTGYASDFMVPQRFPADGTGRWRMFWTGGSFAMGTPYVWQGHGAEMPGGMTFWLRKELERRWPGTPVDLVNVAAGGQNSHRVANTVEQLTPLKPDAWFVATCNNEGALPPAMLREQLHKLGGYRLLAKYLRPQPDKSERSYFTPQDDATLELGRQYQRNIDAMVETTREAGVPLLLATLPIHRLYQGRRSTDQPIVVHQVLDGGRTNCIERAVDAYRKSFHERSLEILEECEDLPDRLQWQGLNLIELQRYEEGIAAVEQSIELLPSNRCRPSFNTVVRKAAAKADHVTLVDLEQAARDSQAHGLPGPELFRDYCHLHHEGYAKMSDVVLKTMLESGIHPPGDPKSVEPLDRERTARRAGLGQIRFIDE